MTLEQADSFEIEHREWLRLRLPSHEKVWKDFIGHDGSGHPLPIRGLTEEEEARRQTFYQTHYTVPLRCLSIDEALRRSEQGL